MLYCLLFLFNSRSYSFVYREWNSKMETTSSRFFKNIQTESSDVVRYKNRRIELGRQIYGGKPVLNSFVKKITVDTGNLESIQALVTEENYAGVAAVQSKKIEKNNIDFLAQIKKIQPSFERVQMLGLEEAFSVDVGEPRLFIVASLFDKWGVPYRIFFNPQGEFVSLERTGSQFSDVSASVFISGPKLSQLSEQNLKSVSFNPSVSNDLVFVNTEADRKIAAANSLKFDPKDDRFDQVQAFYYLSKSRQWMKDQLHVSLPQRLEAVVSMGFPEKTNSAFYYQNKIRFGKGDDLTYSNIVQDPSIVYHESFHALIDSVAHLPFEGEGGSINEAFADLFSCLMLDRPYLGEASYLKGAFKRNLSLVTKLSEKNGGLYHDSAIVSGLLWEAREKLGTEKAKLLAMETLIQLNPASHFSDFSKKLVESSASLLNAEERGLLQKLMKERDFNE